MSKKQKLIFIICAAVVVIIIILTAIFYKPANKNVANLPTPTSVGESNGSLTKETVPSDVKVYNSGESAPENVAVPISVSEYGLTKLRSFSMNAEKDSFSPNTFTCYQGEIINIEITAVDKDYDIVQPDNGLSLIIKKGETKNLQSQMNDIGKFAFYCESCGGLNSSAVGYIIVVGEE